MQLKRLSILLATPLLFFGLWMVAFSGNAQEQDLIMLPENNSAAAETLSELEPESKTVAEQMPLLPLASITDVPYLPENISDTEEQAFVELASAYTIEESVILPHFSARNMATEDEILDPIRQNQIEQALRVLPPEHVEATDTITLDYNAQAHRGLAGGGLLILRATDIEVEELTSVLVHELGHNVDSVFLTSALQSQASPFVDGSQPVYEDDPSVAFYRLSWTSNTDLKREVDQGDFVSGYAMNDPFEDFSEHYNAYLLHGPSFREAAKGSAVLQAKYDFMKTQVFAGQEFYEDGEGVDLSEYHWDMTKLPYDYVALMERE